MKKHNKLEIVGFVMMIIGGVLGLIDMYLSDETFFSNYSNIVGIIFFLGVFVWALGHMKKEKEAQKKN